MTDSLPPDPYKALGVGNDANAQAIKTAYRKLALKHHPDKAQDKDKSADEFHKISQAYELLNDDKKRGKYDEAIRRASRFAQTSYSRGPAKGQRPGYSSRPPSSADTRPDPYPEDLPTRGSQRMYSTRRPPQASTGSAPPPRYEEDPYLRPRDETPRASPKNMPRKTTNYEPSPRKPPPTGKNMDETRKKTAQKPSPKQQQHDSSKKRRSEDLRKAREQKFEPASVRSDNSDSDASDDDARPRRSSPPQPRSRFAQEEQERRRATGAPPMRARTEAASRSSSSDDSARRKMDEAMQHMNRQKVGANDQNEKPQRDNRQRRRARTPEGRQSGLGPSIKKTLHPLSRILEV